jgi:hypothetical protein
VVLEKNGEDQLVRLCEKLRSKVSGERNVLHKIRIRKTNSIGRILRRNRIVKRVMEGKIEGRIKVMGRRGRRSKQL